MPKDPMHSPADSLRMERRQPERQCVGCGRRGPQTELLRLQLDTRSFPQRVVVAGEREHHGRGAYLCRRRSCLDRALQRKAFHRAFRATVVADVDNIIVALAAENPKAIEANNTAGG
jgi:predicted RNA-binding protein YlxR (DUF448 family)